MIAIILNYFGPQEQTLILKKLLIKHLRLKANEHKDFLYHICRFFSNKH